MITASYKQGLEAMAEILFIREEVFHKEQGMDVETIGDSLDDESTHVIAYDHNRPVGVGRIIDNKGKYLIGKIAVLKEMRKKYYGDLIVRMLVRKGFDLGAECIHVCAQEQAVPFYEKIGFVPVGKVYEKHSIVCMDMVIERNKMKKKCQHE